jgi:hypothetical protein
MFLRLDRVSRSIIPGNSLGPLQQHLHSLSTSSQFQVISSVRSYRGSECSAREMLDTVFNVFDRNLDVMGSVVTKILDVFEDNEEKMTQLLAAWNGIKVEVNSILFSALHKLIWSQRNKVNSLLSLQWHPAHKPDGLVLPVGAL